MHDTGHQTWALLRLQLLHDHNPFWDSSTYCKFRSLKEENKASEECKYAFLADDKWLSSEDITYNVQLLEYVPVVLEWTASDFITVDPDELRRRNSEGYPTLYGTQYYYCLKGYQGNPYLPTGCQGQLLQLPTSFHFLAYYSSSFHYFYLFMCN